MEAGPPFTVIEFYPALASAARTLIREALAQSRPGLKPHDAIHLATAVRMGAREIHSYDGRLEKYAAVAGVPIRAPVTPQAQLPGTQG